jgi:hypothetical protein
MSDLVRRNRYATRFRTLARIDRMQIGNVMERNATDVPVSDKRGLRSSLRGDNDNAM